MHSEVIFMNFLFNFLILVYAAKTIVRNMDWYSEENLFVAGIKVNPTKSSGNLVNILHDKGDNELAEAA